MYSEDNADIAEVGKELVEVHAQNQRTSLKSLWCSFWFLKEVVEVHVQNQRTFLKNFVA